MSGATKLMTAGGGGVSLTPASSIASDVTVNVPSQNCTLGIQGPAFSAYPSVTTAMSANTWTKLTFANEEFDTSSCYDTATSKFTPTVAGYYQITANWFAASAFTFGTLAIYKNGSYYKYGNSNGFSSNNSNGWGVTALVYCNGSTDYIEIYANSSVANDASSGSNLTYFQGFLARAA